MTNKNEKYNNINPEESAHEFLKIKKENNFQVPENYFEELPQKIQEKITRKKVRFLPGSGFNLFTKPARIIAVGSLLAIVVIGLFVIPGQNRKYAQQYIEISFEDIMKEEPGIIEYMDDQLLIEFASARMNQKEMDYINIDLGFDSILLQDDFFQYLTDEEISEIIYN